MKKELIYLASPYTHESPEVMYQRFNAVVYVAAQLMRDGHFIFSPISHTHPIASEHALPRGWDYWQAYDELIISRCDRLTVLMLDGWRESKGVDGEIEIASRMGLPIDYLPAPNVRIVSQWESRCGRWKRRAKLFHEAYKEADFERGSLILQVMQLEAYGADKVLPMQNESLRNKLLQTARERNDLRQQRDDLSEEMERCHRLLDAYYGESFETTGMDTLEDRLKVLFSELPKRD